MKASVLRCSAFSQTLVFFKTIYLFVAASGEGGLREVLAAARGLWLRCSGSVLAVQRLSCSAACGVLVPSREIKPTSPASKGGFLITGPPGKSQVLVLFSVHNSFVTGVLLFLFYI